MRGTDHFEPSADSSADRPAHENEQLDEALERADELLVASLQSDERRRVRHHRQLLLWGGIAMCVIVGLLVGIGLLGNATLTTAAPDESGQLSQEGWTLWKQRDYAAAATKFEQAVELAPKNVNAWNGLGWSRFNGGHADEAKEAFEKAIALVPKHAAALNGLGQIALLQRDYKQAEKYLLKAAPQASAAWWGLSRVYLLEGKFPQARKWARKIVDSNPSDTTAKEMLEAAEAGELGAELRKKIEPPEPKQQASNGAVDGWKLFNTGRTNEAREAFEQVLADEPDNGAALNGLGWCLLASGEVDQAKPYFEKVIQANPDAAGAMNGLARVFKATGDVDGAVQIWEKMIERFPGPNAATVGLADTYVERGQPAKARPLYESLVRAFPDNEEFRARLEATTDASTN